MRRARTPKEQKGAVELACGEPSTWCSKAERGERHNLPTACRESILEAPGYDGRPCPCWREIAEWRDRMPVEGGFWMKPISPPKGYAAPALWGRFCRVAQGRQIVFFDGDALPGRGRHPAEDFVQGPEAAS